MLCTPLQAVYSGVPNKAYQVLLKAQNKRYGKADDFNCKNPAGYRMLKLTIVMCDNNVHNVLDAIMDMLNSENWRQAILQQCSQDNRTQQEVKRALNSTTSYDGHRTAK